MSSLLRGCPLAAVALCFLAVSVESAVPSPANSSVDPIIVGNTSGYPLKAAGFGTTITNVGFTVVVRDIGGAPISGAIVTIDFNTATGASGLASGVVVYHEQLDGASCTFNRISKLTDGAGMAIFRPIFGGAENTPSIEVRADGVLLAQVKARSTDMYAFGNSSGQVDLTDFAVFAGAFFCLCQAQEADFDLSPLGCGPGFDHIVCLPDLALFQVTLFTPENTAQRKTPCF